MKRLFAGVSKLFCRHAAGLALAILLLLAVCNLLQVEVIHSLQTLGIARQEISRGFISASDEPAACGGLDDSNLGYVRISLDFLATETSGHPNIFQTGRFNDGIRAEFAGSSLLLLFPDEAAASHLKGIPVAEGLEPGRWHHLELEAFDGSFLNCRVSGFPPFRSRVDQPHFSARDIRVGTAFGGTRRFHGDLRNVTVAMLNGRTLESARALFGALQVLLLAAFAVMLRVYFRQALAIVSPAPVTDRAFYDPLLTLRFAACLMVLAGHALMITHRPADLKTSLAAGSWAWLLTASPWGGVWIFFTLSGYLMGKGFYSGRYTPDGPGIWNFYRNRLLRIAPLYWVSIVLVAALAQPECFAFENLGDMASVLAFHCDRFNSQRTIGALWSVRTEVQFYVLVPLLYICVARRLKSLPATIAAAAAVLAGGCTFRNLTIAALGFELGKFELYSTLLGNIDMFLWGFLLNPVVPWLKHRLGNRKYLLELGFLLLGATYVGLAWASARAGLLLIPEWRRFLFAVAPTLTALATSAIIVCFEVGLIDPRNAVARIGKRTEVLGLITYAVYVWHEPILVAAARIRPGPETLLVTLQSLGGTFVLVFAISLVMYYAIERPFERMKGYARSAEPATLHMSDFTQDAAAPSATPAADIRRSA